MAGRDLKGRKETSAIKGGQDLTGLLAVLETMGIREAQEIVELADPWVTKAPQDLLARKELGEMMAHSARRVQTGSQDKMDRKDSKATRERAASSVRKVIRAPEEIVDRSVARAQPEPRAKTATTAIKVNRVCKVTRDQTDQRAPRARSVLTVRVDQTERQGKTAWMELEEPQAAWERRAGTDSQGQTEVKESRANKEVKELRVTRDLPVQQARTEQLDRTEFLEVMVRAEPRARKERSVRAVHWTNW